VSCVAAANHSNPHTGDVILMCVSCVDDVDFVMCVLCCCDFVILLCVLCCYYFGDVILSCVSRVAAYHSNLHTGDVRVFEGHAFMVEAAVSIGGRDARSGITAYRFANRIPLLFEVGGLCLVCV
jgi:hypothetical protein